MAPIPTGARAGKVTLLQQAVRRDNDMAKDFVCLDQLGEQDLLITKDIHLPTRSGIAASRTP
jgi:hypothetical protein